MVVAVLDHKVSTRQPLPSHSPYSRLDAYVMNTSYRHLRSQKLYLKNLRRYFCLTQAMISASIGWNVFVVGGKNSNRTSCRLEIYLSSRRRNNCLPTTRFSSLESVQCIRRGDKPPLKKDGCYPGVFVGVVIKPQILPRSVLEGARPLRISNRLQRHHLSSVFVTVREESHPRLFFHVVSDWRFRLHPA